MSIISKQELRSLARPVKQSKKRAREDRLNEEWKEFVSFFNEKSKQAAVEKGEDKIALTPEEMKDYDLSDIAERLGRNGYQTNFETREYADDFIIYWE